jgi:hypothetical protein
MSRTWWKSLLASPVIVGVICGVSDSGLCNLIPDAAIAQSAPPEGTIAAETPEAEEKQKLQAANTSVVSTTEPSPVRGQQNPKSHDSALGVTSIAVTSSQRVADSSPASAPMPTDATVLEQVEFYTNETPTNTDTDSLEQVTNVSQLRDVSPGDWAFEALRSLPNRLYLH